MQTDKCSPPTLAALTALAILAAGCAPYTNQPPARQHTEMLRGQEYFLAGDYEQAARCFQRTATGLGGQQAAESYYWLGICRLNQERLHTAEQAFHDCLNQRPSALLELNAWTGIADCYRIGQRYQMAATVYERVLATGSAEIERDLLIYHQGLSMLRGGDRAGGQAVLQRLIREHPASPHSAAARTKLLSASSFFVQTGAFSDRANADRQAARLREKGFSPRIEQPGNNYCVRVGHESTWEAAAALAERVRAAGFDAACMP